MKKRNIILVTMLVMAINFLPDCGNAQSSRNSYNASPGSIDRNTSGRSSSHESQLPTYSANSYTSPGGPDGNPDVPIDGGISILLAAGVALGVKKVYAAGKVEKNKKFRS